MPAEMKSVFSSHVSEIGYDADTAELIVVWQSGKTSAYSGVPDDVAREVVNAASVGSAVRDMIKGVYPHRYV